VNTVNLTAKDNILFINGELTRHSLALINKKTYSSCFEFGHVTVNLNEVNKVDTAGLAWLFCLLEKALASSCEISFIHLPQKLNKLIELSGVSGLLPITISE